MRVTSQKLTPKTRLNRITKWLEQHTISLIITSFVNCTRSKYNYMVGLYLQLCRTSYLWNKEPITPNPEYKQHILLSKDLLSLAPVN
jgi:hypothetical protein